MQGSSLGPTGSGPEARAGPEPEESGPEAGVGSEVGPEPWLGSELWA